MAVKVYNKRLHEAYMHEFNTIKNFNHPNIVKCVGHSEDHNSFYMDLEFCISGDLSKTLWQNKNSKVRLKHLISIPKK